MLVAFFLTVLTSVFGAAPSSLSDQELIEIQFEQKLETQLDASVSFTNEIGQAVRLGDYFGQRPIILVLGYYECPMLCTLVLNGLVAALQELKQNAGQEFEVILISIDPQEPAELALAKKRTYLKRYGRPDAAQGWHFLTGDKTAIAQLAEEVGFRFAYDPSIEQYAHPSGIVVLTSEGKVSQYLFGVNFAAKELNRALKEAASNRVGSPVQQLILLCFHCNPLRGKYGELVMTILRISAGLTIVAIGAAMVVLGRRRRQTNQSSDALAIGQQQAPHAANVAEAGKEAGP